MSLKDDSVVDVVRLSAFEEEEEKEDEDDDEGATENDDDDDDNGDGAWARAGPSFVRTDLATGVGATPSNGGCCALSACEMYTS